MLVPFHRAAVRVASRRLSVRPPVPHTDYVAYGRIQVHPVLAKAVANEVAPGTGIEPQQVFSTVGRVCEDMIARNKALLDTRDEIQTKLDEYHAANASAPHDMAQYTRFLEDIGYLHPQGSSPVEVRTANVDAEIATSAAPQLVVPIDNARFVINAANARWGSLLDAFYGTDAVPTHDGAHATGSYNPVRGRRVFDACEKFLDETFPLAHGIRYAQVVGFSLGDKNELVASFEDGDKVSTVGMEKPEQLVGFIAGDGSNLVSLLFKNNGLHVDIKIDRSSEIGQTHPAGISDIVLESALSTICDCEDSVAAVDAEDKAQVYRNWTGLMKGNLEAKFDKGGREMTRRLNPDRKYSAKTGGELTLKGRSTLLVRNVGHHMVTDAVLFDGAPIPEGLLDAVMTPLAAMHSLSGNTNYQNSKTGSVYIVKPKMHGPEEVQLTCDTFTLVEQELGLSPNTVKIGIMDEERRTSVNLAECLRVASDRVVFINTGFLDRVGDEIHTMMEAGAVVRKAQCKHEPWMKAYEDSNVDIGINTGLAGRGQIGKGMWAAPDAMAAMLAEKVGHVRSGATTAWVPSPTAATLHALHYHDVSVPDIQQKVKQRTAASRNEILRMPILSTSLSAEEVHEEVKLNAQAILGYVVRWVNNGVGCSKVPDLSGVGLMEDRATLRIASQLIANWLHAGITSKSEVEDVLMEMAALVDTQNQRDPDYKPMAPHMDTSVAFQTARALIFDGRVEPNGYTEPALHRARRVVKELGPYEAAALSK